MIGHEADKRENISGVDYMARFVFVIIFLLIVLMTSLLAINRLRENRGMDGLVFVANAYFEDMFFDEQIQKSKSKVLTAPPIPLAQIEPIPQPMKRQILRRPSDICTLLQKLDFKSEGWRRSIIRGAGWECLADFQFIVDGVEKASIFFSMRGKDQNTIVSMRFKFNLPKDHSLRKAYANQLTQKSLGPLFDFFRWKLSKELARKVGNLEPAELDMDTIQVSIFEEYDNNQHIHLIFRLPQDPLPYKVTGDEIYSIFAPWKKAQSKNNRRLRPRGLQKHDNRSTVLVRDAKGHVIPIE
ncbi:MAG: DUF6030 family protein [Cohaesibacter sp.]|nr:DUF6030 family protein [Cohaesibacter sp.]